MRVIHGIVVKSSRIKNTIFQSWRYVLNCISSIIFNFAYLPFSQARHLPIWVNRLHFSKYAKFAGKIIIDTPKVYPRMIKLGVDYVYWYPETGIHLMILGTLVFKGKCMIGNSSTIYVKHERTLTIGDNVWINANNKIICECGIQIGDNSRIGWNCSIMDSDFHYLRNVNTGENNNPIESPITIGRNNWIGSSCGIYKGFNTADYVVIGGGTKCRGTIIEPYTLWANESKLQKYKEGWCRDLNCDPDLFSKLL